MVPVYNGAKHLTACLDSILGQSFSAFEIIVVDNNSTDVTKKIIFHKRKEDNRIRYIFEKKRSRGAARNAGILAASGEIVAMIDSDCLAPKDWLVGLIEPLILKQANIVMGGWESKNADTLSQFIDIMNTRHHSVYRSKKYIRMLDTKNCAAHSHIFNKYLFDASLGTSEDLDFTFRVIKDEKIYFLSDMRVLRVGTRSIKQWLKTSFERGYYSYCVYLKHFQMARTSTYPYFFKTIELSSVLYLVSTLQDATVSAVRGRLIFYITGCAWELGLWCGRKDQQYYRFFMYNFDTVTVFLVYIFAVFMFLPVLVVVFLLTVNSFLGKIRMALKK